ncbi:MAG: phenylacetate-CoA oxygenase/reductase subunit PaaK [Chitinophagaceae bacterium]|nr:phenylacetate-CoA oxygenase/reductase subunit PaaK [Chitinophagaceae bacterium]
MAIHFHPLAVKAIRKQTEDCVAVTFNIPDALKQDFVFVQGQNVTLKTIINGEEVRRSYSICSAPFENELTVAVKKVADGKFSTYANEQLQQGDIIEVLPPTGKFNTELNCSNQKNYLAFAAGSGITPIISIIKTTLQQEPQSNFTLVFTNRNKASIIFFEELEGLKNKYLQRFNLINLLTREQTDADIFFGRINNEKLGQLNKLINYSEQDEFFICGPETMIFCVKDFLATRGIDNRKIHFELFTTPGNDRVNKNSENKTTAENTTSIVQITVDGRRMEFPMKSEGNSILEEALKLGADLPFACKGGVCCTCKAKLLEGNVAMDVNWGLEQEEIERGFILTCQSHPVTEKVVIDFDER